MSGGVSGSGPLSPNVPSNGVSLVERERSDWSWKEVSKTAIEGFFCMGGVTGATALMVFLKGLPILAAIGVGATPLGWATAAIIVVGLSILCIRHYSVDTPDTINVLKSALCFGVGGLVAPLTLIYLRLGGDCSGLGAGLGQEDSAEKNFPPPSQS